MTQKTIKIFINEIYFKRLKHNYIAKKTNVYHIDDIYCLDVLNLEDYGPGNNEGYRYDLVVFGNSSKLVWTVPLKSKKKSNKNKLFRKHFYIIQKKTNFN